MFYALLNILMSYCLMRNHHILLMKRNADFQEVFYTIHLHFCNILFPHISPVYFLHFGKLAVFIAIVHFSVA